MWTCCKCFFFVHNTSDVVNEVSKSHSCAELSQSQKDSNIIAFRNAINSITGTSLPPTPPPLPMKLQNNFETPKLSWNELKKLKVNKFPTVPTVTEVLSNFPIPTHSFLLYFWAIKNNICHIHHFGLVFCLW